MDANTARKTDALIAAQYDVMRQLADEANRIAQTPWWKLVVVVAALFVVAGLMVKLLVM
ncbi:hypothetical protein [Stenotrophomonas acidaminiphila]|jgi:hypothetical protein|uniref:hypothetical protein n=1 Tax=Stenotrophomonas acidaminiphila TaxID=128780 RepID=UPI0028AB1CD9|nr:hypothetical protein [Stenotrophomonas acidaminiphila]